MTSYALIIYLITSYGAVTTQREAGFSSYQDCAAEAVARIESQAAIYQGVRVKWECERK